jgi:hypothetical protein
MLQNLSFFILFKSRLFHNATLFGSYIIHILNTECAKIKRTFLRQRVKIYENGGINWQVKHFM